MRLGSPRNRRLSPARSGARKSNNLEEESAQGTEESRRPNKEIKIDLSKEAGDLKAIFERIY